MATGMSSSPYAVVIRQLQQIGNPAFEGGDILGSLEIQPFVLIGEMRLVGSGNSVVRTMIVHSNRRGIPEQVYRWWQLRRRMSGVENARKNTVLGPVVP